MAEQVPVGSTMYLPNKETPPPASEAFEVLLPFANKYALKRLQTIIVEDATRLGQGEHPTWHIAWLKELEKYA